MSAFLKNRIMTDKTSLTIPLIEFFKAGGTLKNCKPITKMSLGRLYRELIKFECYWNGIPYTHRLPIARSRLPFRHRGQTEYTYRFFVKFW